MNVFITLVSSLFFFSICWAGERIELKDRKDKESYSMGYQLGENLKKQKIEVNIDAYDEGLRDSLGGREPQLSSEEVRSMIGALRQRLMAEQQIKTKGAPSKNLSEAKTFLEENGKKEGVKTLPSGLQYRVLAEGSGRTPKKTDTVTVHYRGTFINGVEFDSSYKRGKPQSFRVDKVIPGWTEALQLMKEGAKWRLFIPPELAYGARGQPGRTKGKTTPIPPNGALIFDVELISVQ